MTLTIIAIVFFHKYSEHMWNSQTNKQAFKSMVISTCSVRYWLFVMMTIDRLFFMMTIDRLFVMMTIYWLFVMMTIYWLFVMMTIDWLFVIMTIDWLFVILFFIYIFLAFDFCRFCVVIRLFNPRHNGQWPPTSKDFLSQILSITYIFLS